MAQKVQFLRGSRLDRDERAGSRENTRPKNPNLSCLDVLYLASLWRQFIKNQEERCRRGDGWSQKPHAWSEELEAGLGTFLEKKAMGPTQGWAESECWASEGHLRGAEAWASEEASLFLSALCTIAHYRSAFPLPVSYPLPFFQTICPPVGFTGRWRCGSC